VKTRSNEEKIAIKAYEKHFEMLVRIAIMAN